MPLGRKELAARTADAIGLALLALHLRSRGALPTRHLTVLNYHRVTRGDGPPFERRELHVTPELFDRQVAILKRFFTLIDTRALDAHVRGAALPRNPALITFDDGYRDNHDQALPILLRHGARATFFISTRYVTERRMFWWDHLRYLVGKAGPRRYELRYPDAMTLDLTHASERGAAIEKLLRVAKELKNLDLDRFLDETAAACDVRRDRDEERRLGSELVMDWDEIRALHERGMDVQSHSRTHRVLTTLSDEEAEAELTDARRALEARLDASVIAVAYPVGMAPANDEVVRRAGYRLGFTTGTGVARIDGSLDPYRVPRFSVSRLHGPGFFRGVLAFPALSYRPLSRPPVTGLPAVGPTPGS